MKDFVKGVSGVKDPLLPYITNTGASNGETVIDVEPLVQCVDANSGSRGSLRMELDLRDAEDFVSYDDAGGELKIEPTEETKAGDYEITLHVRDH